MRKTTAAHILVKMDYEVRNKESQSTTEKKRAGSFSPEFSIELSDFLLITQTSVHLHRQRLLCTVSLLAFVFALFHYLGPFTGRLRDFLISRIPSGLLPFEIILLYIEKTRIIPVRFMYFCMLFFRDSDDRRLSLFRTWMVRCFSCRHRSEGVRR